MKKKISYLSATDIKLSLANTPQITFEITDACNLNCTYCGYGQFYSDHDDRNDVMLSSKKAFLFLDYMKKLWNSPLNKSYNNEIYISFYGGEPLLNMPFIKEVVSYIRTYEAIDKTKRFTFSMTTNAMLLHKHMDYFVENGFNLLISLDGDEYNNSYRINHSGDPVFNTIIKNVDILQTIHPQYFKEKVNFNAVLHNRNSVENIYMFFKKKYNKKPSIGELNNIGIRSEMRELFIDTYEDSIESLYKSEYYQEIEKDLFMEATTYRSVALFLMQNSDFVYKDYNELLLGKQKNYPIPTGTCLPFTRKVFITVNGKILPCERIGHQFGLGQLENDKIELNFAQIADIYNNFYKKIDRQCEVCYARHECTQCIFNLENIEKDTVTCTNFMSKNDFEKYKNNQLSFLVNNPEAYYQIMKKITIK